jgi:hypothetical protein
VISSQLGGVVVGFFAAWLYIEERTIGELAEQLAGRLIDLGILDKLTDQLARVGRGPLGILSRQQPPSPAASLISTWRVSGYPKRAFSSVL